MFSFILLRQQLIRRNYEKFITIHKDQLLLSALELKENSKGLVVVLNHFVGYTTLSTVSNQNNVCPGHAHSHVCVTET